MKFGRTEWKRIGLGLGLLVLVVTVGFDLLYQPAHGFLVATSKSGMAHLSAVTAVRVACGFVPFLDGFSGIVDRILNFLLLSNLIMLFQLVLLEISRSWVLKIVLYAALGLAFVPRLRRWCLRAALVLALVNPGLSVYLMGVKILAQDSTSRISGKISAELDTAGQNLPESEENPGSGEIVLVEPGLPDDVPDPEVRKALWEQITSTLGKIRTSLSPDSMAKSYELTKLLLAGALDRMLKLMLEYFLSTVMLFILLPFAYFYTLVSLVRRFFKGNP